MHLHAGLFALYVNRNSFTYVQYNLRFINTQYRLNDKMFCPGVNQNKILLYIWIDSYCNL